MLFLKKQIMNIFLDLKNIFEHMMNDNYVYFNNNSSYMRFMNELLNVLTKTLSQIESIYYRYFLFPKLHQRVK